MSVALAAGACGKKGPPLAPLVPIPEAIESLETVRFGSDVYVTITLPAANVDKHVPADLDRVDLYGYTGRSAPPRARWAELGSLVATVHVAPPPPEDASERSTTTAAAKSGREKSDAAKPSGLPEQGAVVTLHDALSPDELVAAPVPQRTAGTRTTDPTESDTGKTIAATAAGEARSDRRPFGPEPPLKRFYTAIPFNTKGRNGPPGGVAEFPLLPVPDAPPAVATAYTDTAIVLDWEPSGGLLGFLLERALPEEPLPFAVEDERTEVGAEPSGPVAYLVYREILPDTSTPPRPGAAWSIELPSPITPLPIPTLTFSDTIEFERRRCYTVRAVRGLGPDARVGSASPQACLTPVDVFPPAAPRSLAAVASTGRISLIWEPNLEPDVSGYVVLRGEMPGDTLRPLTPAPVVEAAYRDDTVAAGVRYVYAVIAVDNRLPLPNMSAESSRVEETAR